MSVFTCVKVFLHVTSPDENLFQIVNQKIMLISVSFSYTSCSKTLEDRLKLEAEKGTLSVSDTTVGSKQLTFTLKRVSRRSYSHTPTRPGFRQPRARV